MTRVDPVPHPHLRPEDAQRSRSGALDVSIGGRERDPSTHATAGRQANAEAGRGGTDLERRARDFRDHLARGKSGSHPGLPGDDGGRHAPTEEGAAAGPPAVPAIPPPPSPATARVEQSAVPARAEALRETVLAIETRVERALAAELHLSAGRPVAIDLPMSDLVPGLAKITVSMTSDSLEVVLTSAAGAVAVDLGAVRDLADRLHQRFGRRTVRVVEASAGAAPVEVRDGFAGLFTSGRSPT